MTRPMKSVWQRGTAFCQRFPWHESFSWPHSGYLPHHGAHGGKMYSHWAVMWRRTHLYQNGAKENNFENDRNIHHDYRVPRRLRHPRPSFLTAHIFIGRLWSHKSLLSEKTPASVVLQLIPLSSTRCFNQIKLKQNPSQIYSTCPASYLTLSFWISLLSASHFSPLSPIMLPSVCW